MSNNKKEINLDTPFGMWEYLCSPTASDQDVSMTEEVYKKMASQLYRNSYEIHLEESFIKHLTSDPEEFKRLYFGDFVGWEKEDKVAIDGLGSVSIRPIKEMKKELVGHRLCRPTDAIHTFKVRRDIYDIVPVLASVNHPDFFNEDWRIICREDGEIISETDIMEEYFAKRPGRHDSVVHALINSGWKLRIREYQRLS